MKAMVINKYGEDAVFELEQVNKPELKEGHVLIKIAASSVNTIDTMIRTMGSNLPLSPQAPAILGMDFSGTVEAVSDDVEAYSVGDEVYGCAGGLADLQGTLADFIVADSRLIAHKPKNLSMKEAAALPLVGITAFEGLTRAGISKGQKVLVHGGSGGVGHVAVQLAKYFGADVYATDAGGDRSLLIEKLGATAINFKEEKVEDYVNKYTGASGFDIVFDTVGGTNLANSFNAVALNGQISTTLALCEADLTMAHFKGASLHVVFMLIPMLHNFKREKHGQILRTLTKIIEQENLKPVVDQKSFKLEDVGAAYAHLLSGKAIGKVVVEN